MYTVYSIDQLGQKGLTGKRKMVNFIMEKEM